MAYLTPSTFGGSALSSASWLVQFAPRSVEGTAESDTFLAQVMGDYPAHVDVDLRPRRIALWMFARQGSASTRREEVTRWFAPESGRQTLLATDESGASRQLTCQPVGVSPHPEHPRGYVIVLEAADPIWQRASTCSVSASFTSTGGSLNASPAGNVFARPVITFTPSASTTSTDINRYEMPFAITNNRGWPLYNYPVDVTDGGWDTATLVSAGSIRSDGFDIRVIWHGQEVDHWLDDMDSSSTKVWAVLGLEGSESACGKVTFGHLTSASRVVDDNLRPIFDAGSSTNAHWIYSGSWGSEAGTRPGSWRRYWDGTTIQSWSFDWAWIAQGDYDESGSAWQTNDPWLKMGIRKYNAIGQGQPVHNGYIITHAAGISSMRWDVTRRLLGSGSNSRLQKMWRGASLPGTPWSVFWEDTVDTSAAFTALTSSSATPWFGTAREMVFKVTTPYINGSAVTPDDYGFYLTAVSMNLASYPTVSTSAEAGAYQLSGSLTNESVSPSQSIALDLVMAIGQSLEVDTATRLVQNTTTGCWQNQALELDTVRRDWLPLTPSACNTLRWAEPGIEDTEITVTWRDRWL